MKLIRTVDAAGQVLCHDITQIIPGEYKEMCIRDRSLAGLTLSASMLSLFGCSQQQVDCGAVATWALPQGLLVVNADLCTCLLYTSRRIHSRSRFRLP